MKSVLTSILSLFSIASLFAQPGGRVYFDELGETTKEMATHYTDIEKTVNERGDTRYFVRIYTITDSLFMTGYYMDKKLKVRDGLVTFYANGIKSSEEIFTEDRLNGECRWYHANGQVASVEHYDKGKLLRFELFNEDGTRDTISENPGREPEFPGGLKAMQQFLAENIVYPQSAVELDLQGTAYITFEITPEGNILNIQVRRGVPDCPECDAEAVRVISLMPKWISGKNHNRNINAPFNLPVNFTLG